MAILPAVFATGDMDPIILVIGCLQDQLVEVGMPFQEVKPAIMVHGSWFMING